MKKILSMSLASAFLLSALVGCSSGSKTEAPTVTLPDVTPNTTTVTPPVVTETPEVEPEEEEVELDETSSATLDFSTSTAKVIQMTPSLVVADEDTGLAYAVINGFEEGALDAVTVGSICQMGYVFITYGEGSTGNPDSIIPEIAAFMLIPQSQGQDPVGAYMEIIKSNDESLSEHSYLALDLTEASNLTAAEQEALLWNVSVEAGENTTVFFATEETLAEEGYLEEVDGISTFVDGKLLKLSGTAADELSFTYEKESWLGTESTSTVTGTATCEIETGLFTTAND